MVVKGISRRVVVVRFQDERVFEQAILLLRDGAESRKVSEDEIIKEACDVARNYLNKGEPRPGAGWWGRIAFAASGAVVVCLAWLLTALL